MNRTDLSSLHDIAMEFAEEARFAINRGDKQTAKLFYQKAFNLEKRYALSFPAQPQYALSSAVFLRSAAYLALNSGHIKEAKELANLGLIKIPHSDFIEEFRDILNEATFINNKKRKELHIQGIFVSANLSNNQICIQDTTNHQIYIISVPNNKLEELVKSFWAKTVSIKGKANEKGQIQLKEIKKAA